MIDNLLSFVKKNPPWSNTYGLARSVLACGTFMTLLFNSTDILFKNSSISSSNLFCDPIGISLYCLFADLEFARFISILLLIPVIIGWRPMITGVIHFWVSYSLINSAVMIDGGDHIASILTVLLIPITLTDTRKWHWSIVKPTQLASSFVPILGIISFSSFIIIKIQIAIIYLNSAVSKLFVEEWVNGTAIYYWFKHPIFGYPKWLNPILEPVILNGTTVFIVTWGTILFEFILFAGLFMDIKFKKWLFIFGTVFHFGIFIVHGLASFFFTMLAALILYLAPIGLNYGTVLFRINKKINF